MSVLPRQLLPDNATVGSKGQLLLAGCDTLELADRFGTPLFVYDEAHLRARCREAVSVFGEGVNYATKAFLCKAMATLAFEEGMNLDVSTGGEYHVARAAGVPAERLVLDTPLLTALTTGEREKRRPVALSAIPDRVVQAVLAVEDRRYYEHPGVDPIAIIRAVFSNLIGHSAYTSGASTITQQVVRNVFLPQFDGWTLRLARQQSGWAGIRRKLLEQFLALVLNTRAFFGPAKFVQATGSGCLSGTVPMRIGEVASVSGSTRYSEPLPMSLPTSTPRRIG